MEKRGTVVGEFSFPANSIQQHAYVEQLIQLDKKYNLRSMHDRNTEKSLEGRGSVDPLIFYQTRRVNDEDVLVIFVTNQIDEQSLFVQIYSGAISDTELSTLNKDLRRLAGLGPVDKAV